MEECPGFVWGRKMSLFTEDGPNCGRKGKQHYEKKMLC